MVKPWVDMGWDAILVDPQHGGVLEREYRTTKVGYPIDHPTTWDFIAERLNDISFVAAFPPCTSLSISGARWFSEKAEKDPSFQFKAMHVVWQCHTIAELTRAPYFIENPVSMISTFWRKPDFVFQPYQYTGYEPSDNYKKRTCLWTGGGFIMPPEKRDGTLGPPDNRIHMHPENKERANVRSATPKGFAQAVYEYNNNIGNYNRESLSNHR